MSIKFRGNANDPILIVSSRLRSLSIVLQDTEIVLSGCEIDENQKKRLDEIATNCNKVLNNLKEKLGKYSKLGTDGQNAKQRVRRVWDQLRWEPEDIREIRAQITSNISLLSTYMANISKYLRPLTVVKKFKAELKQCNSFRRKDRD